jgi:hypothetical protein
MVAYGPKTCGSGGSGSATLSTTQLNTSPPPPPHSHTVCTVYTDVYGGKGGGGEVREKIEGQQYTRGVENTNMIDCISSL